MNYILKFFDRNRRIVRRAGKDEKYADCITDLRRDTVHDFVTLKDGEEYVVSTTEKLCIPSYMFEDEDEDIICLKTYYMISLFDEEIIKEFLCDVEISSFVREYECELNAKKDGFSHRLYVAGFSRHTANKRTIDRVNEIITNSKEGITKSDNPIKDLNIFMRFMKWYARKIAESLIRFPVN